MNARFKLLTVAAPALVVISVIASPVFSDAATRDLDAIGTPIRPAPADPAIAHALQHISSQQIQHTIETLAGFQTRSTLSSMGTLTYRRDKVSAQLRTGSSPSLSVILMPAAAVLK